MIWRPRYMVGISRAIICSCFSRSFSLATRTMVFKLSSSLMPFFNNCKRTNSPWRETIPKCSPVVDSIMTASPVCNSNLFTLRKYSLRPPLNLTSTTWKRWNCGTSRSESQSKTFILLQPPVPHPPLLWQPATSPVALLDPHDPVEHDLHAILCVGLAFIPDTLGRQDQYLV